MGGEESGGQAAVSGDWHYTNVDSLENPNVTVCLYWDPNEFEQAAISEFEAKYGGKVTVEVVGWNKGANAIMTAMATGDIPDLVFTEGNARFPLDAANELYQPIDAYLDYDVCDQASADAFLYRGGHYVYMVWPCDRGAGCAGYGYSRLCGWAKAGGGVYPGGAGSAFL
ncbi:MAG TPA: hypothetical protein DCZ91_02685 [Lachnospiraceae bacterium]|nr:hypothetical protein [Lachnospiraceae bacterium]